eukprot:GILI01006478.1.p1 GENE.GILI01006478.1~~GILI01006478.1.p1  ORF type:complete len:329 (-),score=60.81 GILI01006478.1:710-1651(-)
MSAPAPTSAAPEQAQKQTSAASPSSLLGVFEVKRLKLLVAGGLAGTISRTATSPLERLKILRQAEVSSHKYDTLSGAFIRMWREEGFRGFFKGNFTNIVRIAPHSAVQFYSFDLYKRMLGTTSSSTLSGAFLIFSAGAMAGMTSSTLVYPLDLVRSVLSVQTTDRYRGIMHCVSEIYKAEGLVGLYRGWGATLMGIAPYVAINMTTFDVLKAKFLPDRKDPRFDIINLSLGAVSGAAAATATYPTDVVRRRMQLQGFSDLPQYDSIADCVRKTIKMEGVRGLYKGMVPCYLKVIPSVAISFMTYERLKVWMGV